MQADAASRRGLIQAVGRTDQIFGKELLSRDISRSWKSTENFGNAQRRLRPRRTRNWRFRFACFFARTPAAHARLSRFSPPSHRLRAGNTAGPPLWT